MDSETLFYLLLVVAYVVYQIVGSRNQSRKPSPRPQEPHPPRASEPESSKPASASDELDQALREIRQALGMEPPPAPAPSPAPEKKPQPVPAPKSVRPKTAPPEPTSPQQAAPWAEQALEAESTEMIGEADTLLEEVEVRSQPASAPASRRPALLERLRTPGAARDAIVLSEILGPPRSKRH